MTVVEERALWLSQRRGRNAAPGANNHANFADQGAGRGIGRDAVPRSGPSNARGRQSPVGPRDATFNRAYSPRAGGTVRFDRAGRRMGPDRPTGAYAVRIGNRGRVAAASSNDFHHNSTGFNTNNSRPHRNSPGGRDNSLREVMNRPNGFQQQTAAPAPARAPRASLPLYVAPIQAQAAPPARAAPPFVTTALARAPSVPAGGSDRSATPSALSGRPDYMDDAQAGRHEMQAMGFLSVSATYGVQLFDKDETPLRRQIYCDVRREWVDKVIKCAFESTPEAGAENYPGKKKWPLDAALKARDLVCNSTGGEARQYYEDHPDTADFYEPAKRAFERENLKCSVRVGQQEGTNGKSNMASIAPVAPVAAPMTTLTVASTSAQAPNSTRYTTPAPGPGPARAPVPALVHEPVAQATSFLQGLNIDATGKGVVAPAQKAIAPTPMAINMEAQLTRTPLTNAPKKRTAASSRPFLLPQRQVVSHRHPPLLQMAATQARCSSLVSSRSTMLQRPLLLSMSQSTSLGVALPPMLTTRVTSRRRQTPPAAGLWAVLNLPSRTQVSRSPTRLPPPLPSATHSQSSSPRSRLSLPFLRRSLRCRRLPQFRLRPSMAPPCSQAPSRWSLCLLQARFGAPEPSVTPPASIGTAPSKPPTTEPRTPSSSTSRPRCVPSLQSLRATPCCLGKTRTTTCEVCTLQGKLHEV